MSEFFSHYPKIAYNITGEKEPSRLKVVIDIMNRAKIKNVLLNDIVQFEPYSVPENERPDVTAHKFYGDVKYTWLLFAVNEMHDPIWDWPLGTREFVSFVERKYGTLPAAQQGIHHYERVLRQRVEQKGEKDAIPAYKIKCDFTTYKDLPHYERDIIYYYEYEVALNESKRDINILKSEYAAMILAEHTTKLL